jgi:Domain of unknown function (DUF4382)
MQIDLLAQQSNACFLATLGVKSGLQAGKYNQIRIFLEPNNANVSDVQLINTTTNACGSAWNCVVDSNGTHTLKLNSEAKTGLKIPPGQIAHGGLRIASGQGADINIKFNACQSIVRAGNSHSHHGAGGSFMLKPVLHAGELGTNALISGTVVEGTVNTDSSVTAGATAVPGANVWLEEQPTAANYTVGDPSAPTTNPTTEQVENVVSTTTTDSNGNFDFCGTGAGTYEIVTDADALSSTNASDATITTGVNVTATSGVSGLVIPLVDGGSAAAKLEGEFTAQGVTPPGAGDNITFNGVQPLSNAADAVQAIIPPLIGTTPAPATVGDQPFVPTVDSGNFASTTTTNCPDISPAPSCSTSENCGCFTLALPEGNPVIGTAAGGDYMASTATSTDYSVTGAAANLTVPSTAECAPSALITDPTNPNVVTGGSATSTNNIPTLSFAGCD